MGIIELKKFFKKALPSMTRQVTKAGKRSDSSKKEDFQIDPEILLAFFRSDPVINSATWAVVENVVPGYDIEPIDDSNEAIREVEEGEQALSEDNWMEKMKNIVANETVFANCYQEASPFISEGKRQLKTFILDTQTVKIKLDKQGEIKSYDQYINGKKVASLDPEFIIHYKQNPFGDRDYGLSSLESVLFSAALRKFIDKFNGSIFQNHKPRGAWVFSDKMDKDTYNDNVDLIIEAKSNPNKDIFLRGDKDQIGFTAFLARQDTAFQDAYKDARDEVLIGMRVPRILIFGGSNKAGGDVELQGFDRRVISMQEALNKQITEEVLKAKLGLHKVKFVLRKANRRDEIRELEIVQKMSGLVTLNEARIQIGMPELDIKEFPDADSIWSTSKPSIGVQDVEGQRNAEDFAKSIELKKKIESKPVKISTEKNLISKFSKWVNELRANVKKEISDSSTFSKQSDPKEITDILFASVNTGELTNLFLTGLKDQYFSANDDIGKSLNKNFMPNEEELKFLEEYNFDLVQGLNDRTQESLRNALRRGLLEGKSTKEVTSDVMKELDKTQRDAEALVRTELNRVNSTGALNAVKQADLDAKKYILITDDERTADISKAFGRKYGTPENAIPVNDDFSVTVRGRLFKGPAPPFHISDRDALVFTFE